MNQSPATSKSKQVGISLLLLLGGFLVFVLGCNYYSVFPTNDSQLYRGILAAAFLGAALVMRRRGSLEAYSQIAYAFFVATMGYLITSLVAGWRDAVLEAAAIPPESARYLTMAKLFEAAAAIATILILSRLWGRDLVSLYVRRGRLGLALFVGISLGLVNTATGVVTGTKLGYASEVIISELPWAILFALANGLMEELWFRGLFLDQFTAVIGETGSIIVTSVIFTVMHSASSYMNPVEAVIFQIILLPMALLLGYLMVRTKNVWGAALYHAGSDVFMFYLMDL